MDRHAKFYLNYYLATGDVGSLDLAMIYATWEELARDYRV